MIRAPVKSASMVRSVNWLGIFWLKEPLPLPKALGLLILLIGLTLVAGG